jgi:hypothetical protein
MADVPQRSQPPEKRPSLAEMAAKAAQRSASSRPPPVGFTVPESSTVRPSSAAPPPSSFSGFNGAASAAPSEAGNASGDGSGLINLQRMQAASSLTPATTGLDSRHLAAPVVRTELTSNPFEKKGRSRGLLIGAAVVLLGVGATYGIAAQRGTTPMALVKNALVSLKGGSDTSTTSQFSVKEEAAPKADSPAAPPPAAPKPVAPSNLPAAAAIAPTEATDITADGKARAGKSAKIDRPTAVAAAPAAAQPAETKEAPAPKPAAQPDPPGLAGAIKKAVGPTEQAPKDDAPAPAPAAAIRGDIPEAPPQGAIQGALGSIRGAARSCVAGHDAPSRATIVFASTGKVQSVSVSGPAAGTPAEGCIKSALSKANVGAFQRSSFSVSTTITPP